MRREFEATRESNPPEANRGIDFRPSEEHWHEREVTAGSPFSPILSLPPLLPHPPQQALLHQPRPLRSPVLLVATSLAFASMAQMVHATI